MSTICIIAVCGQNYTEASVRTTIRPKGLLLRDDISGGEQLLILQSYIIGDYKAFEEVVGDVDANIRKPQTAAGWYVLSTMINSYDGLVDDKKLSMTIYSRPRDVRFAVGGTSFSDRMRMTIRRNAGYEPEWEPCGMKVVGNAVSQLF
ncbi:hypothetical protein [Methylobacterium flocculans]|uniref:hypothetical protein n=1 Tax=Methylobacterium flocculans TaxID=2984843 RepID=UPI0021F36FD2|nr:hypothetical protein [Methylobacterium sp. FF17]